MCTSTERKPFRVAASYDTETTNIRMGTTPDSTRAFPVLFILLDLRERDLREYEPDGSAEFYRHDYEFLARLYEFVQWGLDNDCVPIVCAYNLMFDLQPLMHDLSDMFEIRVAAQSSTHVYTLDLLGDDGEPLLRFWDTYYLEMRGLAAMGDTCGLPKASGDWDYTKVRTPETPLTEEELYYAGRDVEVIPAYLRYLLESNEWLEPDMLGSTVLTKTSLVRQMGKLETGRARIKRKGRKPISVYRMMVQLCRQEQPKTYSQYALRKACFRGGFTFTAATWAGEVQRNVYSLDETSAHHAYINGHLVPVNFRPLAVWELQAMLDHVNGTSIARILEHYEEPFGCAFHLKVRYEHIRVKRGSIYERAGICTLAESKFKTVAQKSQWESENGRAAEDAVRGRGFHDWARMATFAFGKLVKAEACEVFVSELEAWIISQVYEFDSCRVIMGEGTRSFVRPPDYVTLMSNLLFERKQAMKRIVKNYTEGEPYPLDIPDTIPPGIAARLRDGSMTMGDVQAYYQSTVKGQFNSIYGMEAQDVYKPEFEVPRGTGEIHVNPDTTVTPENWEERRKAAEGKPVLYTYGLRIVGGSRLPIVIAIELLDEWYGDKVRVLGGDTDSLKIACDGVDGEDLLAALEPLHQAVRRAIALCMRRVRDKFSQYASTLDGVGEFEVEGDAYPLHMDAWNKARVSWDGEHAHITCAGLSRPAGTYNIETWIDDMVRSGWSVERLFPLVLGWGVHIDNTVCHHLERHQPKPSDRMDADITDYTGRTAHVTAHESIALYASDRVLGDTLKGENERTVRYLQRIGRGPDTRPRYVSYDGRPVFKVLTADGWSDLHED